MSEWKEVKLVDFIKVKHGFAFKGIGITKKEAADILVTPGNFHIGGALNQISLSTLMANILKSTF